MERADFHGHPILHPEYEKKFGLEKYVRLSIERGITIPPITAFTGDLPDSRFQDFYEDSIPQSWHKEQFREGFVVFATGQYQTQRIIFFRTQEIVMKDDTHLLLAGLPRYA